MAVFLAPQTAAQLTTPAAPDPSIFAGAAPAQQQPATPAPTSAAAPDVVDPAAVPATTTASPTTTPGPTPAPAITTTAAQAPVEPPAQVLAPASTPQPVPATAPNATPAFEMVSAQATDQTPAPSTAAAPVATVPAGPVDLLKMTPRQISFLAAHNIGLAGRAAEHYTYKETVHEQNFIDGKLVVDHTTVTENLFINDLPYMRKTLVDGKPLEGKELKQEQKLYDQAVKERRALDAATRAQIARHALRSTVGNIDKLPTSFDLKIDGHTTVDGVDCLVLDAMPLPDNQDPDLAQHIRIAMEADTGDVLDVTVELLAPDRGFSKGSLLHTHYAFVGANALPDHQTWDTTVTFMELMNKAIRIHRDTTYTEYKRFRSTATIQSVKEASPDQH